MGRSAWKLGCSNRQDCTKVAINKNVYESQDRRKHKYVRGKNIERARKQ